MSSYVDSVVTAAIKELGVTEVGFSNSGPRVNQYLAAVGLGPGNPWCAAFVFFVTDEVGVPKSTWEDLGNRAYCPSIESWARSKGVLKTTPQRGDFMLLQMWDNDGQYSGHIGIVEQVEGNQIHTIEGNTSPQGSGGSDDNGGGVYRRIRSVGSAKYVNWSSLVAPVQRVLKVFANYNGRTVVIDGKTYPLTSLDVNGKSCDVIELIAKY